MMYFGELKRALNLLIFFLSRDALGLAGCLFMLFQELSLSSLEHGGLRVVGSLAAEPSEGREAAPGKGRRRGDPEREAKSGVVAGVLLERREREV